MLRFTIVVLLIVLLIISMFYFYKKDAKNEGIVVGEFVEVNRTDVPPVPERNEQKKSDKIKNVVTKNIKMKQKSPENRKKLNNSSNLQDDLGTVFCNGKPFLKNIDEWNERFSK